MSRAPSRDSDAIEREGEDHGGEADAERPAGLGADVEVRDAEQAAEQETGQRGAQRELRHVAAVDVVVPPAVLLLAAPVANLVGGQLLERHAGLGQAKSPEDN